MAAHVAGNSNGSVFALVVDEFATTGHDYQVAFDLATSGEEYVWNLRDLTLGIDLVTGWSNQSGDDNYPVVDGLVTKVIGPPPGVGGWDIPAGERRISWANADGLHFEGFYGAIGWASPASVFGSGVPGVPSIGLKDVLLKLADADTLGLFNPIDPNVSYAYRFGRGFAAPPARPEFAPFILNPVGGYSYQEFAKSVPLSAWDVESDPPRRLVLGHLENNVPGGMVDGRWWPGSSQLIDNVDAAGPREWLWIFDVEYSETPDPALQVEAIGNPLPIMYFLTVSRRGQVPFATGDEFLIERVHANTEEDVYEFTAPPPPGSHRSVGGACYPGDSLPSLLELFRTDSVVRAEFLAGICHCDFVGDGDSDGEIDAVDLMLLINAVFFTGTILHDSECPRVRFDVDCDGRVDVVDLAVIIDYIFFGGEPLCNPCDGLTIPY